MTPTNEDLLALADRLDGVEIYSVRANRSILGTRPIEAANNAVCEAAAALRVLVAERQAIRDQALEDAAQAASNRAAYFRDAAETASEAGFHALRAFHAMRELCLVEIAAAIRAMKGKPE